MDQIHSKPIDDYKLAYSYLQAFTADFEFNKNQPIEKVKLLALIYQLSKNLFESHCASVLKENGITDDDLSTYFKQLMEESLD